MLYPHDHPESLIGLDFETYSPTDITKHGLDRYVNDPHFTALFAAATVDNAAAAFVYDFEGPDTADSRELVGWLEYYTIVSHNAGFEQAVLQRMGFNMVNMTFIDSAVVARACGAAGKLEAAAPQLLGADKMASGMNLIKLFCIPGPYQAESLAFNPQIIKDHPEEWEEFKEYCKVDAALGRAIVKQYGGVLTVEEQLNFQATAVMNETGWQVDRDLVREMQQQYLANVEAEVMRFREDLDAPTLNLSSYDQLKTWCAARGVRAKSFNEEHVTSMRRAIAKKLDTPMPDGKRAGYEEVDRLLQAKQAIGGSGLKKLQTLLDTIGEGDRLRDQYFHIGAGATYRTTGRGVQMQNLKRLNGDHDDVLDVYTGQWDNYRLGANIRQVFTASDPKGFLIVGDFSSVESRGLAWQAGEQWKLDAYARGEDLYKVQAAKFFGKPVEQIDKAGRTFGKVGELSCGYQAGAGAVKDFAAGMGVELTEGEAAKLVKDWRETNPEIVKYWYLLDDALHGAIAHNTIRTVVTENCVVAIQPIPAPTSLAKQLGFAMSLKISLYHAQTKQFTRFIHGVHLVGKNIQYYKPSERKGGDLWVDDYMHPKTKRRTKFTLYGGKLAGLLTQSLCREIFFTSLRSFNNRTQLWGNVKLVGQFHDEIVVDWVPMKDQPPLEDVEGWLEIDMCTTKLQGFPLAAEIKRDFRYTK